MVGERLSHFRILGDGQRPLHLRLPYMHPAGHTLALAHLKQGRAGEAVSLLEEAVARYPRDARIREDLRRAREAAGG